MFQNAKDIVQIFGIRIRIDPSWLIIAALIVWSLSVSYFPSVLPDARNSTWILLALFSMVGLFVSLLLHELAHSVTAQRFGLNVGSITLFILGGVAELERDPESAVSEFWIALAGPVVSFFLGLSCLLIARLTTGLEEPSLISAAFEYIGMINLFLAIFNLLPAFPMDGGRILRAVLWGSGKDVVAATKIACRTGNVIAIVLIIIGALFVLSSNVIVGIWQVFIAFFILSFSRASYDDLVIRQTLKGYNASAVMTGAPWTVEPDTSIGDLIEGVMLRRNVSFIPVVEGNRLLGYVDAAMIQTIEKENWNETRVGDIFVACDESNSIAADTPMEAVFDKITRTGNRKLLVADGTRLQGVVSLADLMTFLGIRKDLASSR